MGVSMGNLPEMNQYESFSLDLPIYELLDISWAKEPSNILYRSMWEQDIHNWASALSAKLSFSPKFQKPQTNSSTS